jgi:hypothetical protein
VSRNPARKPWLSRLRERLEVYEEEVPKVTRSALKISSDMILFAGALCGLWLLLQSLVISHIK